MEKKRKADFCFVLFFSFLLTSCSNSLEFSKGYNYEIGLQPIEIAYYLEKDVFKYKEDVNIYISYGHDPTMETDFEGVKEMPFCLFLDYAGLKAINESDYREYNGYKLIEEVEPALFYTENYLYHQDGYGPKTFKHTMNFAIPFDYFEHVWSVKPHDTVLKFIAGQLYEDDNKIIHMQGIRCAEIELVFAFDEETKNIRIQF